MPEITEVRPKVFVDPDGDEWRSVDGVLQARTHDEPYSGDDEMEPAFGVGFDSPSNEQWLAHIRECCPQSLPATEAALAHPMTHEEAEADDATAK